MTRRILQFGTSRFLQAHVDLFVHQARLGGADVGPITIVKTTDGGERAGRLAALGQGFPVVIRGLVDGQPVETTTTVTSVAGALSIQTDPTAVRAAMLDADIVVSNTGDAGYEIAVEDRYAGLIDAAALPRSFPAKLLQLLAYRWANGARPLALFPCELINHNGRVLKQLLIQLAQDTAAPGAFVDWLQTLPFANSLVDRIVSAPIEPAGAIAEPYALWAIERALGVPMPVDHPQVVMTDDLERFERLKLHILNLGHTWLADIWHRGGRPADETVRAILTDPAIAAQLDRLYAQEVIPGFAARGLADEATAYVATTLDRFRNPFLDHRIADIHGSHAQKVARRITAFKQWIREAGASHPTPMLDAVEADI